MSNSTSRTTALIQQIASERFGIIVSEKRAERLLTNQFALWSIRKKIPIEMLLLTVKNSSDDHAMVKDFISYITIGESYFFRHKEQLDALVAWVKAHIKHPVRIWCAACSIGCEVYSLSYLLKEAGIEYHILGTDIDRARLDIAKNLGPYGKYSVRTKSEPPTKLLQLDKEEYWVTPEWSYNVQFRFHNLQDAHCPTPPVLYNGKHEWDIIICRNAFIYFTQEQTRSILQTMSAVLSDAGSLWVGVNDALFNTTQILEPFRWQHHMLLRKLDSDTEITSKSTTTRLMAMPSKPTERTPDSRNEISQAILQRCIQNGYTGIAKTLLGDLLRQDPNDIGLQLTMCTFLVNEHQLQEALSRISKFLSQHKNTPEVWYFVGLIEYTHHNTLQAKQAFEKVVHLDAHHWAAYLYLGTILIKEKSWLYAEVYFEEAKKLLQTHQDLQFSSLSQPQGFHEDRQSSLLYIESQLKRLG